MLEHLNWRGALKYNVILFKRARSLEVLHCTVLYSTVRGSSEGHQRVIRGTSEGHQRVITGFSGGHQRVGNPAKHLAGYPVGYAA